MQHHRKTAVTRSRPQKRNPRFPASTAPNAAPEPGCVYVLTNVAMPGLVKIGCTGKPSWERAAELSHSSGVPKPFVVAWHWPVDDYRAVEKISHDCLDSCRPNGNREFFTCSIAEAKRAIKRMARLHMRPWWMRLLLWWDNPPPSRAERRRRERRVRSRVPALLAAAAVIGSVAWIRPAAPLWLPASVQHTLATLESIWPAQSEAAESYVTRATATAR